MPILPDVFVTNNEGGRSRYSVNVFVDHLVALGVPRLEAREVAAAVSAAVLGAGRATVTTNELRRLAHDVASWGAASVATAELLKTPGGVDVERAEIPEQDPSIFGSATAAFALLTDVVREVNKPLADVQDGMLQIIRCICEQVVRERQDTILECVARAGLGESAREHFRRMLLASPSPLTAERCRDLTAKALTRLRAAGHVRDDDVAGSLRAGLIADFVHAMHGGQGPAPRRYWAEGTPVGDLPPQVRPQEFAGGSGKKLGPLIEYRMEAAIEFPSVARYEGEVPFSLYAVKTIRGSDDIEAPETAYLGAIKLPGVRRENVISGPVAIRTGSSGGVIEPYRANVEHVCVDGFWDTIEPGAAKIYTFSFFLVEKSRIPLIDTILDALGDADERLDDEIEELADQAGAAVGAFIASNPALLPLSSSAKQLSESVVKSILGKLKESLLRYLGHTTLPTWTLTHAVIHQPPAGPTSAFTLQRSPAPAPAERTRLFRVERLPAGAGTISEPTGVYPTRPGHYQQGRDMHGASQVVSPLPGADGLRPLTTNPAESPTRDLWRKVAEVNQPTVWIEPDQGPAGFRVLVPMNGADRGSYVAALRADVVAVYAGADQQ